MLVEKTCRRATTALRIDSSLSLVHNPRIAPEAGKEKM